MDPFIQALAGSPAFFPHLYDPGTDCVTFSRLTAEGYAKASFLDQRTLQPTVPTRAVPFTQVEAAAAGLPEACDFLFHIGHVGSTLLARLLGQHPALLALREPAILRSLFQLRTAPDSLPRRLTDSEFEARLSTFLKLWSRTFAPGQCALIKATSYVSELAAELLARPSAPRAIFMTVSAEAYLATILGAEHSPREAREFAPSRLRRLKRRFADIRPPQSLGELVAMGWGAEMCALREAAAVGGARVLWLDFDAFLAEPKAWLAKCFTHLDVDAAAQLDAIATSDDMRRYSKAPEHAYDTGLRSAVLTEARVRQAAEIRRGLAWLEQEPFLFTP